MTSRAVDVTLLGRAFRIVCAEGEERELVAAVNFLDERMQAIRDRGKVLSAERIAIMAALNITHEYLTSRVPHDFDIESLKGRMNNMLSLIDSELARDAQHDDVGRDHPGPSGPEC